MVRVKLNDGTEVLFEMSWEEMHRAFNRALSRGEALDVQGMNGKVWAINPNLISYFEVVEPATAPSENGAHPEVAADRFAAPA